MRQACQDVLLGCRNYLKIILNNHKPSFWGIKEGVVVMTTLDKFTLVGMLFIVQRLDINSTYIVSYYQ